MDLGLEYVFVEMDFSPAYRETIKAELQWSTFPIIVKVDKAGEYVVGGYNDLIYELSGDSGLPA